MNISGLGSTMSAVAAAQDMFAGTAQAAAGVTAAGSGGDATAEALQVAVLQKALEMERSTVNILA